MNEEKIKQLAEQEQYKPYRFQGIEWDIRDEVRTKVEEAVSDFKERLRAKIEKERDGAYWLGESEEKAIDFVLDLLDTTE